MAVQSASACVHLEELGMNIHTNMLEGTSFLEVPVSFPVGIGNRAANYFMLVKARGEGEYYDDLYECYIIAYDMLISYLC